MRVLIVGGTGTIGQAVANELCERHEVIPAGHRGGDVTVDMTDIGSIEKMYKKVGRIDALIVTAGSVHFEALQQMSSAKYQIGLQSKLIGQVNLVLAGLSYLNDGGSFTLTSGSAPHDPYRCGSSAAIVNGGIEGFIKGAAIEMPRGLRINAVSPSILPESMEEYGDYFRGFTPVPAKKVAIAYSKSVEGAQTGQVYCVWS